jgi:uncharacterized lipoprotein YmbA
LLFLVAGCGQSQQSRLYTLSDLSESETLISNNAPLTVGVGPVTLPQYLDRPHMVVRQSPNRLAVAEFDRWAESLTDTVPRVLTENLGALLGSERVYRHPSSQRRRPDLTVRIAMSRFEGTASGSALLVARWEILAGDSAEPLSTGRVVERRNGAAAGDYEAMAAQLSDLLTELSRIIAENVVALQS